MKLNLSILKNIFTIIFTLTYSISAFAEIHLPSILGNNMVLQQMSNVNIWGRANENKKVTIYCSWDKKTINTKSDFNGNWKIQLKTPKAGGPYEISISDGKIHKIRNVLIGEVWLCSGQSNMEMPLKGYNGQPVKDAQQTISKADPNIPIRFINVEKNSSLIPVSNFSGEWKENNPENVRNMSAVAFFYAQYLQSILKVPVGIITSSWGGSSIEAWMDSVELSKLTKVDLSNNDPKKPIYQRHCQLYNAMIYPLHLFKIKGVLWYQGESNIPQYSMYKKMLPAMVAKWRSLWNIGNFPFYYAQIAPWKYELINFNASAQMREVQQQLEQIIPNSGMVVTLDIGDSVTIHPPLKKEVGERFGYLAISKTYNYPGIAYQYPQFKSIFIKKDTAIIELFNVEEGIHSTSRVIKGFEIAGVDGKFKPAKVFITNNKTQLKITEPSINEPIAVRYGFRNYIATSILSNYGLPLAPFRTDEWTE